MAFTIPQLDLDSVKREAGPNTSDNMRKLWMAFSQMAQTVLTLPVALQSPTIGTVTVPANTTFMVGANIQVTPSRTGRLAVAVTGNTSNSSVGGQSAVVIHYGIGTPPVPTAVPAGVAIGPGNGVVVSTTNEIVDIASVGLVTGLAVGTTYWIDLAVTAVTGISNFGNFSITIVEV
jgi:hypothetical protein